MAAACGCINKLQLFPMNFIAGPSQCTARLSSTDAGFEPALAALQCKLDDPPAELQYSVDTIATFVPECVERVDFVVETYVVRSDCKLHCHQRHSDRPSRRQTRSPKISSSRVRSDLVHFGLVKAIMNFVTGLLADRYGRRLTMLIGWIAALPMPLAVLAAGSWASVSATNLLLGLQQAICWSTSIFIMLDYAGKENGGLAVGLNETSGAFRSGVACSRNDWGGRSAPALAPVPVCNSRMTLVWADGQDTWLWLL